jgi:hypothetical protein
MHFLPTLSRRKSYQGEEGYSGYRKYKLEISDDCAHRCVYCDLHANYLGGYDMMELDHLRPKAKKLFPHLKNDPFNLLFACRSCNGKKHDDWPAGTGADTFVGLTGYIDPFGTRQDFYVIGENGCFAAKQAPAQYVIDRLSLNRPLAVAIRRKIIVVSKLVQAARDLKAAHDAHLDSQSGVDVAKLKKLTSLMTSITESIAAHVVPQGKSL